MMGEFEIFGVYLNSELVTSLIALVVAFVVHRILMFFSFYRHVWHRALFETALFVILWGVVLTFFTYSHL